MPVKYKKNRKVSIEMSLEQLEQILKGHNHLKDTLDTLQECSDVWLSQVSGLQLLLHHLHDSMDFKRGENYWNDYTLPPKE